MPNASLEDLLEIREKPSATETNIYLKKNVDIMQALRKFSNPNIFAIAQNLSEGQGLTFEDLRIKTSLSTNVLNHNLIEMRNKDLVIFKSKKYFLTKFGLILFNSIINLVKEIKKYGPEFLFSEISRPKLTMRLSDINI